MKPNGWWPPLTLGPTFIGFFVLMLWLDDQPWWRN